MSARGTTNKFHFNTQSGNNNKSFQDNIVERSGGQLIPHGMTCDHNINIITVVVYWPLAKSILGKPACWGSSGTVTTPYLSATPPDTMCEINTGVV